MSYQVHLQNFEGPLDLLLYFIQRDRIDIYDIPIAEITVEYLSYLEILETLNITVAGEFILLAATLMRIKARMLLPGPQTTDDELIEDPRTELVQQLLQYQQIRQASEELSGLADRRSLYYPVGHEAELDTDVIDHSEMLNNVSLFNLMAIFKDVSQRMKVGDALQIRPEPVRLDDCIRQIAGYLEQHAEATFRQILETSNNLQDLIVTFLALLEMIRRGAVRFTQESSFDPIILRKAPAN